MSYDLSRICLRVPVEGAAKAVLLVLAYKANKRGKSWPGIDSLVLYTGWKRTSVIEAVQQLEDMGLIAVLRAHGRSNLYTVLRAQVEAIALPVVGRGDDDDDDDDEDGDDDAGNAARPNQSATRTGPPREPVRVADPTSTPGGPHPSAGRTLSVSNCQELSNTPQPPQAGAAGGDGFQEFWNAYPRREAMDRAQRAWRKLKPDAELRARMLAALAVQRQGSAWQREGGRFVPLPGRWLRGQRWMDGTQADRQRAVRGEGWQDDPAQVKAVGASIDMPFTLAGLGNGWTDDQKTAHYRRYRAQVIAAVQAKEATA